MTRSTARGARRSTYHVGPGPCYTPQEVSPLRKTLMALGFCLLLDISGPIWPRVAEATPPPAPAQAGANEQAVSALVKDYRAVRKVALALTVIGFLVAITRLGISEFPAERHRAESLAALMAVLFVLVAGDRTIVRGVSEWFNISPTSLPPFWR